MTTQTRARKGGEVAPNGEFYEGGRFINTIAENAKKEVAAVKKARKVQIEPYVWVLSDKKPLLSIVGGGAEYINRNDWKQGIRPYAPAFTNGVMYTGTTITEVQGMCDKFNAGERFV